MPEYLPPTVAYLVLVVLLAAAAGLFVVVGLGAVAAWRGLEAAASRTAVALSRGVRAAARREATVQQLAATDVRYLPCHSFTCGHLETVHRPDAGGGMRCEPCGALAATEDL
ncbi:hypothetical protein ACRAR1_06950 [Streptomyces sanyensis]|uniref:hypothetical protein n=1 Tax=Streptomyces sanyensis TaxID=568869 RepID=UPI003D77E8E8